MELNSLLYSWCSFQFHFGMESALVSVISYPRNIPVITQKSKYCGIQKLSNLMLNLIVIEGLFQHTARASLPHIILLQDLFFQLFRFLIFVLRLVVYPLSLCFNNSDIWCLGGAVGFVTIFISYIVLSMFHSPGCIQMSDYW